MNRGVGRITATVFAFHECRRRCLQFFSASKPNLSAQALHAFKQLLGRKIVSVYLNPHFADLHPSDGPAERMD
jgi:hypothetical protein